MRAALQRAQEDHQQGQPHWGCFCIGVLAKGLRKEFGSSARIFVTVLLDKFKDKNTICVNNVAEALGYMHM